MKIRLYGSPFWSIFWACMPLHIFILLVPIINLCGVLTMNCSFESVKYNLFGGLIYFIVTSIGVCVPFFIRRFKYQQIMILSPSKCFIVLKGTQIVNFYISDMRFELDYPTLIDVRDLFFFGSSDIVDGHVNLEILNTDGDYFYYKLYVSRRKAKKIKQYIDNHAFN